MGKVIDLKLPKEPQSWILWSDIHERHNHPQTTEAVFEFANQLPKEQRNLLINGDLFDFPFFMKKNEDYKFWKNRRDGCDQFFLPRYEEEINWGNKLLDDIDALFSSRIIGWGNHDAPRVNEFRESICPMEYRPHFNLEKSLNLENRNVGWFEYNDWLDFGNVSFTHGMYHGPQAYKKHYEASGSRSVIFGHVHKYMRVPFTVRNLTRFAMSLPAGCNLNPHYIRNSDNDWENGFVHLVMYPNGTFDVTPYIFNGQYKLPNGKIIK